MHIISPFVPFINLFGDDGSIRHFASKSEALESLGIRWIGLNVGKAFMEFSHYETHHELKLQYGESIPILKTSAVYKKNPFIMCDCEGTVLTEVNFCEQKPWSRMSMYYGNYNGTGPVPHTGVGPRGRSYRHPKTRTSQKMAVHFEEYGEPPIRAKRNVAALPTVWDDLKRQDRRNHNWKSYRKTQWKNV